MTTKLKASKPLGLNGVTTPKGAKEYTWAEMFGLREVIKSIKASNPNRSIRTDFWLHKNEVELDAAWKDFYDKQGEVVRECVEFYNDETGEYIVHRGKDETDLKYAKEGMFFGLVDGKIEPCLEYPTWEFEVQPATEEKAAVTRKLQYSIKFKNNEAEDEYNKKMTDLQQNEKYSLLLSKLSEKYLDGIQVSWRNGQQDLESFRALVYENLISE